METNKCERCRWWARNFFDPFDDRWTTGFTCFRFPAPVGTAPSHLCGEFQPKDTPHE
jgi:hypothetical protein